MLLFRPRNKCKAAFGLFQLKRATRAGVLQEGAGRSRQPRRDEPSPFPRQAAGCGKCVAAESNGALLFCLDPQRSCPECRVISEFVIPSAYWVEDQEKKNELIEAFKQGVG